MREMELLENCCSFENEIIAEEADIKSCKEVSCSIAKQLKSETQQLSQLQMVLHHLQERAKELHKSRDAWQNRAFHAKEHESTLLSSVCTFSYETIAIFQFLVMRYHFVYWG